MIFTLAALYLYTPYREDRYQRFFLAAVVLAAAIVSCIRRFIFFDEPFAHSIQVCLPISLMIGFLASAIIYRMGFFVTSKEEESEWKPREKKSTERPEKGEKQGSCRNVEGLPNT